MDQLFVRCRTGELFAGRMGPVLTVTVGQVTFKGDDEGEVWTHVFKHFAQLPAPSPEYRTLMAGAAGEEDDAQAQAWIDALTEGGMSDLGLLTEQYRRDRRAQIDKGLQRLQAAGRPFNLTNLREITGLDDLTDDECLRAYSEGHSNAPDSREPVPGADAKNPG